MCYLQAVAQYVPEAILTLGEVVPSDDRALAAWAHQWGFEDEWTLRAARTHVKLWRDEPRLAGRWHIVSGQRWAPVFPALEPWDPREETEDVFDARAKVYKEAVKAHSGLRKPVTIPALHFEWLARHHVARWTYEKIATHVQTADWSPDIPSVSDAIRTLAQLVGLTLRKAPGRASVKLANPDPR